MDKKNLIYALVPLAVLASVRVALGQLPADLSVPTPIAALSGPSISPNLSAGDITGSVGASDSGSRSRSAVGGGLSLPGRGSASALGSQGSFVTLHSAALSSPASLLNGHEKALQQTWPTAVRASAKAGSRSVGGTSLVGSRIGSSVLSSRTTSTMSSPRSFSSPWSVPEGPLYSFLVNHDKGSWRSTNSPQGFSLKSGRAKKSRTGLIQSLTGAGGGLGSSR
jgi:hypothetical protein